MKKILIYGDSNVWGDNFITMRRIEDEQQWPNILEKNLNNKYKIYQCGLPGRVAGSIEEVKKYKNGKDTFLSTYRTCSPVDILIIMLGTNDLQIKYNRTSEYIYNDLMWYKEILKSEFEDDENKNKYFYNKLPRIIYILPVNFDYEGMAKEILTKDSELKRQELIKLFKESENEYILIEDASLFDDGIHLSEEGHKEVARVVGEFLNEEDR